MFRVLQIVENKVFLLLRGDRVYQSHINDIDNNVDYLQIYEIIE